jgi:hypothetical protein
LLIEGIPLNRIFERKGVEIPNENKKAVDDSQAYQNLFEVSIAHTILSFSKELQSILGFVN